MQLIRKKKMKLAKNDISARPKRIQIRKTEIKQAYRTKPMNKKNILNQH